MAVNLITIAKTLTPATAAATKGIAKAPSLGGRAISATTGALTKVWDAVCHFFKAIATFCKTYPKTVILTLGAAIVLARVIYVARRFFRPAEEDDGTGGGGGARSPGSRPATPLPRADEEGTPPRSRSSSPAAFPLPHSGLTPPAGAHSEMTPPETPRSDEGTGLPTSYYDPTTTTYAGDTTRPQRSFSMSAAYGGSDAGDVMEPPTIDLAAGTEEPGDATEFDPTLPPSRQPRAPMIPRILTYAAAVEAHRAGATGSTMSDVRKEE